VVEQLFPQLARQPAIPFGTRIMRYLLPPTPAADAGHSIARVLFPRYVEGAPVAVEHLDPTASLVRLGEGGSVLPDTDEGLAAFLALWARTPAYQITYGQLDEAVAAILELVDQKQQRRVGAIAGTADAPV
jgi:hypothetical protein